VNRNGSARFAPQARSFSGQTGSGMGGIQMTDEQKVLKAMKDVFKNPRDAYENARPVH